MRFAFALPGSRGDVQPAIAVALELRRNGHEVSVGVAPDLVEWTSRLGFEPVPIGLPTGELFASEVFELHKTARNPRVRWQAVKEVSCYGWDQLRDGMETLAAGADAVVTGLLGQEIGSAIAERDDLAFAALHYCPIRANSAVPLLPGVRAGGVQKAAWKAVELGRWQLTRQAENAQRRALGLVPAVVGVPQRLRDRGALEIQAYERMLVPGLPAQYGTHRPFTGFLNLSADERAMLGEAGLGDELAEWLDAGDPPVYVGFGSLSAPVGDPGALMTAVVQATQDLGLRALVSGWHEGEGLIADHVRAIGPADHSAVFPKCVAAVHHGGAGTVGSSLRAGIPTVVAWVSSDQPMWGGMLRRAGVGVSVRAGSLDRERLRTALGQALAPEARERAAAMRDRMVPAAAAVAETARLLEHAR